jgi:GAF domain-containing protein
MVNDDEHQHAAEQLLERVAEIAQRLAEADTLDELLQRIVDMGADYLDGCDGVSMMLVGRGGRMYSPAYSSTVARDSDLVQYEVGEGPCLSAMQEHATVIIDDLGADDRWPAYRAGAVQLGVASVICFRLFVSGDTLGALDFYSSTPHAFDEHSRLLGQVFASHACVALKAAITESGLEQALASRDVIGQAKGILMTTEGLTADAAFARLVELSQGLNRPLRDVAKDLVRRRENPGPGPPGLPG